MNISMAQTRAIIAFLESQNFEGYVFDPNDHDESVHGIQVLAPHFSVFSFKPAVSPKVINGGTCFRHGVGSNMFNAIVTGPIRNGEDRRHVVNGLRACVDGALVFVCNDGSHSTVPQERYLVGLGVEMMSVVSVEWDTIVIGKWVKP